MAFVKAWQSRLYLGPSLPVQGPWLQGLAVRQTGLNALSYGQVATDSSGDSCDCTPSRKQLRVEGLYFGVELRRALANMGKTQQSC